MPRTSEQKKLRRQGIEDCKAGKTIDAFYSIPWLEGKRKTEGMRAVYGLGWRSVRKNGTAEPLLDFHDMHQRWGGVPYHAGCAKCKRATK